MDVQIIDADCVQIGKGAAEVDWVTKLRANEATFLTTFDATEIGKRENKRGFVYVVRLWGRSRQGRSVCLLVVDAWSTSYRKLVATPHLELVVREVSTELGRLAGSASQSEVSVVYRKSTQGYTVDSSTQEAQRFPWLRMRVASAYLRQKRTAAMRQAQKHLERLRAQDVFLPAEAESRVEVHSELLEVLGLRPGGWVRVVEAAASRVHPENDRIFASQTIQLLQGELQPAGPHLDTVMAPLKVLSWDIECLCKLIHEYAGIDVHFILDVLYVYFPGLLFFLDPVPGIL